MLTYMHDEKSIYKKFTTLELYRCVVSNHFRFCFGEDFFSTLAEICFHPLGLFSLSSETIDSASDIFCPIPMP